MVADQFDSGVQRAERLAVKRIERSHQLPPLPSNSWNLPTVGARGGVAQRQVTVIEKQLDQSDPAEKALCEQDDDQQYLDPRDHLQQHLTTLFQLSHSVMYGGTGRDA